MTSFSQNSDRLMRYGHQLYEVNPSLSCSFQTKQQSEQKSVTVRDIIARREGRDLQQNPIPTADRKLWRQETGEVLTDLLLGQEFVAEQFVKFYLDGIRQYAQLNKPGANLFEFIYEQLSHQESQGKDTVYLNYILTSKWKPELTRRTYSRGLADLLDKEFLFRSMLNDIYFINVRFMFNGDRLALVRSVGD